MLIRVAVVGILAIMLVPWLWWLVFLFGWVIFPAFGLLVRGIAGAPERETEQLPATNCKERKLLEAVREHGELTPARAAMETSLSVAGADWMLKHLAEGGHPRTGARGVMGGVVSFFSQGWEGA